MTSEPDSAPRRRPPTIDLTATEVDAEKPTPPGGATATGTAADAGTPPMRRGAMLALGTVIGLIVMAAVLTGLWFAGYVPSHQAAANPSATTTAANTPVSPAAAPAAAATTPAATTPATTTPAAATPAAPTSPSGNADAVAAALKQIEAELAAQRPDPALVSRLNAVEATTKSLGDSLAALNRRVDDVAAAAQSAAAKADAASSAASSAAEAAKSANQSSVKPSDLDALSQRIAAVESAVNTLSAAAARPAPNADDTAARFTVAAQALDDAVERGVPFQAELAAAKSLGADPAKTATLESFAATGTPRAGALARQLTTLLPALRQKSAAAPAQGSLVGRLEASAQNLVHITSVNAPPGNGPAAVMARIAADARDADIDAALADIGALPAPAQAVAADWVKAVQARDAARAASRGIVAAALTALTKPNPQ